MKTEIISHLENVGPIQMKEIRSLFPAKNLKSIVNSLVKTGNFQLVCRVDNQGRSFEFLQKVGACKQNQLLNFFQKGNRINAQQIKFLFDVPNPSALINDLRKKKGLRIELSVDKTVAEKNKTFYSLAPSQVKAAKTSKNKKGVLVTAMDNLRASEQKIAA